MSLARRIFTVCITLAVAVPAYGAAAVNRCDGVMRLVRTLPQSSRARLLPFGRSFSGRQLPAYIISDFSIDYADKTRVFICSGQHGDEFNPMRSVLALSCRLASGSEPELLKRCVFIVVPMVNPDGVAASTRLSGVYDLNRGWRGLMSPEARYVDELIKTWRPHLLIDVHEQTSAIPAGGDMIEAPHCLTPDQQTAVSALAGRISSQTGLRLATCLPAADKQLFHRNYACLGYGAYLLETSVDAPYPTKQRFYTSAILGLARAVSEDAILRAALSPSARQFNAAPVRAYLRPLGGGLYASASFLYGMGLLAAGYVLCLWVLKPFARVHRVEWSRRYVRCEVEEGVPTSAIAARRIPTPLTCRSWVHRRLRARYTPKRPQKKENQPQGIATFITPRYSREHTYSSNQAVYSARRV